MSLQKVLECVGGGKRDQQPKTFWNGLSDREKQASVDPGFPRPLDDKYLWNCEGLVKQYWEERLLPELKKFGNENMREILEKHEWNEVLRCWMFGKTIQDAKPTVQMICVEEKVFERFWKKLRFREGWESSGFKMICNHGRDTTYTAAVSGEEKPSDDENDAGYSRVNLMGRPAFINGSTFQNVATLAGKFTVLDQTFALTTCHAFIDTEHAEDSQESLWELSETVDTQDWTSNCSDNDSETDSEEIDSSTPIMEASVSLSTDALAPEAQKFQAGNFLPIRVFQPPGTEENSNVHCYGHDLDWAIVALDSKAKHTYDCSYSYHGIDRTVTAQARLPEPGRVLLIARQAKSQHLVKYTGTSVLISPPGSRSLCRAYVLAEEDSGPSTADRAAGESGALVLDPEEGAAYGMIIARSSMFKEQYMVPIEDILVDVSKNFPGETANFLITADFDASKQPGRVHGSNEIERSFEEGLVEASNGIIDKHDASRLFEVLKMLGLPNDRKSVQMADIATLRKNLEKAGGWEKRTVERVFKESNTGFHFGYATILASFKAQHTALLALMPLVAWLWDAPAWLFEQQARPPREPTSFHEQLNQQSQASDPLEVLPYKQLLFQAVKNRQIDLLDHLLPYRDYCAKPEEAENETLGFAAFCGNPEMIDKCLEMCGVIDAGKAALSWTSSEEQAKRLAKLIGLVAPPKALDDFVGAMELAAMEGDMGTVGSLVKSGANASESLVRAARDGHEAAASRLLEEGLADVNFQGSEYGLRKSALHAASESGHLAIVNVLLGQNADVFAKDWREDIALHSASRCGHVSIVERLLQVDTTSIGATNEYRETALHQASRKGHARVIEVLLLHGAECKIQNVPGSTALHLASLGGHTQAAEVLLGHGAAFDVGDSEGETALHMAIKSKEPATVDVLLQRGADANARNALGYNALSLAIRDRASSLVGKLPQHGVVDFSARRSSEEIALHLKSRSKTDSVVDMLLRHDADVNARTNSGDTALHEASRSEAASVVDVLLRHGAIANARNNLGETALCVASRSNATSAIEMLLQSGAAVNARNDLGETALCVASRSNAVSAVHMLLRHGAAVNAQTDSGETALDVARKHSRAWVAEILLQSSKSDEDAMESGEQRSPEIAHGAQRHTPAGDDDKAGESVTAAAVEEDVGGGSRSSPTRSPTKTRSVSTQPGEDEQPKREDAAPQLEGDGPSGDEEGQRDEDEYTSRGHSLFGPFKS